jgi:hypothetical protein
MLWIQLVLVRWGVASSTLETFFRSLRTSLCHFEAISFAYVCLSATNIAAVSWKVFLSIDLVGFIFDNAQIVASFMGLR